MRSITLCLITKSQDAALTAVQIFNNPLIRFKSENFIVLMNVAWTYLLHAYYRKEDVEYRYYQKTARGKRYDRTPEGTFKFWDLRKCISVAECPLDNETKQNLAFLIGLRDEIVHHMSPDLDQFASARYQACCINYNREIKRLFGEKFGIDQHLSFSLQFTQISRGQLSNPRQADLPKGVSSYIAAFDSRLSETEISSERFAFRMLFIPKLVGKPGQADEVIEFIRADSEIAQSVNQRYMAIKEVEKPKYRPKIIVDCMHTEGYPNFRMHDHTELWKSMDAKKEGKGLGVEVSGSWYWYQPWLEMVRSFCNENASRFQ